MRVAATCGRWVRILGAAGVLVAWGARAQLAWEINPETAAPWVEQGLSAMDRFFGSAQTNLTEVISESFRGRMEDLLVAADAAMQDAHPEDMAELQPYLRSAVGYAQGVRELAPYAAWLEARLDYFDAARSAVALTPAPEVQTPPPRPPPQKPPAVPPSKPPAKPTVKPPAKPASKPPVAAPPKPPVRTPRPPPPAEVEKKRVETATSRTQWRKRVAGRAKPVSAAELVPVLKRAFRSAGVPEELVWVAEVESTMNPEARSPRGAVGLYQITAPTARTLGLSLSPTDERKDPARSAAAAATYLRRLHGRFGSWPLALAAYNCGEGRISGLLKKKGATSFEGISDSLPMETRMYVPRVLETVRLREGIDPDRLPPPGTPPIRL